MGWVYGFSFRFPFEGTTCIAVRSLPFAMGQSGPLHSLPGGWRFRLFEPETMRAGTATMPGALDTSVAGGGPS